MIFGTLWYMLEEMNTEGSYELSTVTIDEEKEYGIATIKNTLDDNIKDFYWDKELNIWIKRRFNI